MDKTHKKNRSHVYAPWKVDTPYCTIPDRLQLLAQQTPDKEAIIFVGENNRIGVTYKEIVDEASCIAKKMVEIDIKKKDVVAIHDDKSPAWLFYTFGAMMCGAWPLHFSFQQQDGSDVTDILKRSKCKVVITQPGDGDENIHMMKSFIQFNEDGTVQSEEVPSLKRVLFFRKSEYLNQIMTFEDIVPSADKDLPEIEPEDIAAIFCSSGSTGLPKLIPWNHNNLIATSISTNDSAQIRYGEPVFYDRTFGWFGGYPREMFIGVPRVTNSTTFKGKSVNEICDITVKIVNQEICEHVVLLSSIIEELMKGNYTMKHVKTIISSGGPVSSTDAQLVGRLCDRFINMYGSTECGVVSLNSIAVDKEMKSYDTGQPFPGTEVKIVDTVGRLCEVGTVGEVFVRNRSSSTGYLHEEQDWHQANRKEGYWFKTGDAGYIAEDGHLFVAGRVEESIMIKGKVFSPSHFEDIYIKHPYVEDVVAFGIPHEVFYEVAGVALTLKEGKSLSSEELYEIYKNESSLIFDDPFHASKYLPKQIIFFDIFPKTNSGKTARKIVKETALKRIFPNSKND